jgi:hypothetical protein
MRSLSGGVLKRFGIGMAICVSALLALGSGTSVAMASPAAVAADGISECEKKGKKSGSRQCQQGAGKKNGTNPPKLKGQALGDCEAMNSHLADAASSVTRYRRSAVRIPALIFVGKPWEAETRIARDHLVQAEASFASARRASAFGPNREFLSEAIDLANFDIEPSASLGALLEELRRNVVANVDAGRC